MVISATILATLMAAGPVQAIEQVDVAYEELASGQNEAAIREIKDNEALEANDPARLINLGVAYARMGDVETARELFRAAIYSADRHLLETSNGEWVDSRILARQALASVEPAQRADTFRMATR